MQLAFKVAQRLPHAQRLHASFVGRHVADICVPGLVEVGDAWRNVPSIIPDDLVAKVDAFNSVLRLIGVRQFYLRGKRAGKHSPERDSKNAAFLFHIGNVGYIFGA